MIIEKLECPLIIKKFEKHEDLKHEVLRLIDQGAYQSVKEPSVELDISKTDWSLASDTTRKWATYLYDDLMNHMLGMYKEMGFDNFTVNELWFQQYYQTSQHGWHVHGSNFTNVYYLELPDDSPKTELLSPFDRSKSFTLDVSEGDTVLFPSFVFHRAPPNLSINRKTIISFNIETGFSDEQYRNTNATI